MKSLFSRTGLNTYFVIALVVLLSTRLNGQWVDKNESENYTARHECSVVQAGNKFYLMGGRENAKTLDVYDYTTDTWTALTNSAPQEFNHFQATEYKGLIWVIAAFKTNAFPVEQPTEFIWSFNPANQEWIKGPSIPANRRRGSTGLVVYNNKFYISGGNTIGHNGGYVPWFDEYDPATGIWTALADAPRARDHFHAGIIGDKMYLAGGRLSGGTGGVFKPVIAEVDVYDFNTSQWSSLPQNLPTPRGAPSVAVFNNKLVVIGGEVDSEPVYGVLTTDALSITEEYDPSTQVWTRIGDLNHKRHGTQAIVSGNGIFILAGSPLKAGGNQKNMEYFGQDAPVGSVSTASTLTAPNSLTINANTSSNFNIDISEGNVGVIVRSMQISGSGASNFQISAGTLTNALLDAGSSKQVTVNHNGSGETAILTINYGASSSVDIALNVNNSTTFDISSSSGPNGNITPSGNTNVVKDSNQTYTITPNTGFSVKDVLVDGNSVGVVQAYTFSNVTETHTISVNFEATQSSHIITATAGTGGTITPAGPSNISEGLSQEYTLKADDGFIVADIVVDNVSVGAQNRYTFTNVTENHTINVVFTQSNNNPPKAVANANVIEGNGPLTVEFDGSGSTDDTGIVSYAWDFGDDSAIHTTISPSHIFTKPGVYTVTLSVKDSDAMISTNTITITVIDSTDPERPELDLAGLLMYPNPASEEVIMVLPDAVEIKTISLFDTSGKYIETLSPIQQDLGYSINISTLSIGIYGVKIVDVKGKKYAENLVITR